MRRLKIFGVAAMNTAQRYHGRTWKAWMPVTLEVISLAAFVALLLTGYWTR